ncbi:COG4695 Phage-related protein [uncultured Caudovirales phage]|jgi:HK97 family phage portal protein|uniref:COG4695 Phage-related protein n=1 Tax=uncultured Caudovirales phage TaxID=2100421 RepID=A0A6J5M533_9CAUD|nr:COG4695 Phage-related protein [uncultured Caudovirales phage]
MQFRLWPSKTEKRSSLSAPPDWLVNTLSNIFGIQTKSGAAVNENTALSISSVHACVRVISDGIAGLSLKLYKDDGANKTQITNNYAAALLNDPNSYQTKFDFIKYMVGQLVLKGNAYAFINRDARFIAYELHPIRSEYVEPIIENGQLFYRVTMKGYPPMVPSTDMLHFKGLCTDNPLKGKNPIQVHAESLGIDLAAISSSAGVYKNGVLKFLLTSDAVIKPEQAANLKNSLDDVIQGQARSTVLPNGIKMEKLSLSPEEAQYIEQRKFSAQEIARMFGVPASMIGASDGGIKSSVEQEFQDFYARTLLAYAINIEQEMGRKLLTEQDKQTDYFKFNFNSLLRATANDRADFYNKGIRGGWLSPNEARMFEDMNGYGEGAGYMVESNLIPAEQMGAYMDAKIINLTNKALNNNNPTGDNNNTQA